MKIRTDFVTNSSSASYILDKNKLTEEQIALIYNHLEAGVILASKEESPFNIYLDPWIIEEKDDSISCHTSMDNFDMGWFLRKIGCDDAIIEYDHS